MCHVRCSTPVDPGPGWWWERLRFFFFFSTFLRTKTPGDGLSAAYCCRTHHLSRLRYNTYGHYHCCYIIVGTLQYARATLHSPNVASVRHKGPRTLSGEPHRLSANAERAAAISRFPARNNILQKKKHNIRVLRPSGFRIVVRVQ